jgi:hypothetical protein
MRHSTVRKRTHHYVWKHYLRAWARNERIFTRLNGKLLDEKLDKVAQERDFYQLKFLTDDDVQFVRWFVVERAIPHLRESHENALNIYLQAQHAVAAGRRFSADSSDLGHASEVLASNFTEDWHASLERGAAQHIDELRRGSVAFYESDSACLDFTLFLATQYFRTKAVKERAIATLQPIAGGADPSRMWELLAHMFANNVGWSLFSERKKNGIKLLMNQTDLEFTTSDQPVVNIATGELRTQPPEQMTLYYPVGPNIAIVLGDPISSTTLPDNLGKEDVSHLNSRVAAQALLRVFGRSEGSLKDAGEA